MIQFIGGPVDWEGGHPEPNSIFEEEKKVLKGPHRTILGHPQHVLHLVLSPNAIAKAFNVMLCIGLIAPLILAYFGQLLLHNFCQSKELHEEA